MNLSRKKPRIEPAHPFDMQVWLDLLPPEICLRVASLVTTVFSHDPALALAQTSPYQGEVIGNVVCKDMLRHYRHYFWPWMEVLGSKVESLNLVGMSKSKRELHLARLLVMPRLKELQLNFDVAANVMAHNISSSLQTLHLFSAACGTSVEMLSQLLKGLKIRELTITCGLSCGTYCIAPLIAKVDNWSCGEICPYVTKFEIDCSSHDAQNLIDVLSGLPALQEITLNHDISYLSDEALVALERCQTIHLRSLQRCDDYATLGQFGERLRSLCFCKSPHENPLDKENLRLLSTCTQLEVLEASIVPGSEVKLLPICRNLKTLELTWCGMEEAEEAEERLSHYCPEPGTVLSMIKQAPFLTHLNLRHVTLPRSEIEESLKVLGAQLESFTMCEAGHGELAPRRLEFVMQRMAMYNPRLKRFRVKPAYDSLRFEYCQLVAADIPKMMAAVEVLRRRTQVADMRDLYGLIWNYLDFMMDEDGYAAWEAYVAKHEIDAPRHW